MRVLKHRLCRTSRPGFERPFSRLAASGSIDDKTNIACFTVFARRKKCPLSGRRWTLPTEPGVCVLLLLLFWYPSTILAYSPEPNNAALLYYQAFISFPDNYNEISMPLHPAPSGIIEPNEAIRDYLKTCHNVFEFTRAAVEIPECHWGFRYSLGDAVLMPQLLYVRHLCFHIMTQAQVYGADKEYQKALDTCLIIHKVAQHVGDENLIAIIINNAIHASANKGLRQTLSLMPLNQKTLVELERELTELSQRPRLNNALNTEEKITLAKLALNKDALIRAAKMSYDGSLDPKWEARLRKADQTFLESSQKYYVEFMVALRAVIEETVPFDTKYGQIKRLDEQVMSDTKTNPNAVFAAIFRPKLNQICALTTLVQSGDNLLRTAIQLYKTKAQTGSLPEALPTGLPKNMFTDKDFDYEKTDEGFILRLQTKECGRDEPDEFHFKVK
jgi:hypothetical protein